MNTLELQQQIIELCKQKSACQDQFKTLLSVKENPIQFVRVLLNNHYWCILKGIYTAQSLLEFDLEILHRAGLALNEFTPVDFQNPTQIGDLLWCPMNEGTDKSDFVGASYNWDDAMSLKLKNKRVPTYAEYSLLAAAPRQWGLYGGNFGMTFRGYGNNLFLPATEDQSYGSYWSSSPCPSYADYSYYLYFNYASNAAPSYYKNRSNGFSLRCVQEIQ